jgi:hypothetical protein
MPYTIKKTSGTKPWKIIGPKGKVVGSSSTRKAAEASVRARYAGKKGK